MGKVVIYKAANASSTHFFCWTWTESSLLVVLLAEPKIAPTAARTLFTRFRWRIRLRITSLSIFRQFSIGFMLKWLVTDTESSFSYSPSSSSVTLQLSTSTCLFFDTWLCRLVAFVLEDMFFFCVSSLSTHSSSVKNLLWKRSEDLTNYKWWQNISFWDIIRFSLLKVKIYYFS